jgi:peptide/nickel transport system substrate-binding protein
MRMNDLVCDNQVVIPVVYRPSVVAISHTLRAAISGWDNNTWNLRDWYREV